MWPLLLLLYSYSSHYQPELLQIVASKGIIIFCLSLHTTHLLQPLDGCSFGSLKRHWMPHLYSCNPGRVVTSFSSSSLQLRWRGCPCRMASSREAGVYPTNRDYMLSKLSTALINTQQSQDHPSISVLFMPFCTPWEQPVEIPQPSASRTPECISFYSHDKSRSHHSIMKPQCCPWHPVQMSNTIASRYSCSEIQLQSDGLLVEI